MTTLSVLAWGSCILDVNRYPDWSLPKLLEMEGFHLVPFSHGCADVMICIDLSPTQVVRILKFQAKRKILLALEPSSVSPFSHGRLASLLFQSVGKQSPLQVRRRKDVLVEMGYLPEPEEVKRRIASHSNSSRRSRNEIAVANGLKFSFTENSQYHTRLNRMKDLAKQGFKLTVAGKGWTASQRTQYLSAGRQILFEAASLSRSKLSKVVIGDWTQLEGFEFLGWVQDEIAFFSEFPWTLSIENDFSYISEKLFNPILAGSLPLYSGALEILKEKPPIIDLRELSTYDLKTLLAEMPSTEYASRVLQCQDWITSSEVMERWGHEIAFKRLAAQLPHWEPANFEE